MVSRKDVAEKAGVSPAVVSRVINNSGYVADEKRKKVLQVVKELSYNPHPVAVSLKKNRTKQVLYYVRDLKNYYYMEMYRGMAEYAASKGYVFIIAGYMDSHQIGSLMVDGILLPSEDHATQSFLEEIKVPFAIAGYEIPVTFDALIINVQIRTAISLAYAHLRQKGHRKIGFASMNTSNDSDPRQNAFIQCLKNDGIDSYYSKLFGPQELEVTWDEMNFYEMGVTVAHQYMERPSDITAIICFNDDIAIGLMSVLSKHGISIPDDLSIVGIDGHFGGVYTVPALTSVSLAPELHGKACAEALIQLIEEGTKADVPDIEPYLIERESVKSLL